MQPALTTLYTTMASPVGELLALGTRRNGGVELTGIYFPQHRRGPVQSSSWRRDDAGFASVREQLSAYFAGDRTDFDLPLACAGSGFQQAVWAALRSIPYGATTTYGNLARAVGGFPRAVGTAVGRNPVSIVVPCHRVIGANGALTGYAGGLAAKRALLGHEAAVLARSPVALS